MKSLIVFAALMLPGVVTATGQPTDRESVPPNVLLIAVDDLRPELGYLGADYGQSPNLDRFAKQSVTFANHFVQVPTCGASRYALLTGRSPMHSQALGNAALYQGKCKLDPRQLDSAQTFPELFRRNGYHTVCIGKISHTADGKVFAYNGQGDGRAELPHAWDELATPYGEWKRGWGIFFAYHDGKHREDGKGNKDLMEFVAQSDDELPDGLMATRAIEKLRELKDRRETSKQPFLMGLGFFKPHLPWVATQADWDALADIDIPIAARFEKPESLFWHRSGEFYKYHMPFEKTRPLARADQRDARRAYLACVRYVDRQIGRVLKSLGELGLAENTIVVIWGDHGWHLGESAIWGKHSPFDRSLKSVLMIRAPGVSVAGQRCNELVETIDVYPTLIDLCDPAFRETTFPLDGFSLRSMLEGGHDPVRSVSLSYFGGGFTARTKTHRYIARAASYPANASQWDRIAEHELYDLTEGEDPVDNVLPGNQELLKNLIRSLPQKE